MDLNNLVQATTFWTASAMLIALYAASLLVYRLFLSPLAKFPGPKFSAICGWVETYYDVFQGGQFSNQVDQWHEQYGSSGTNAKMVALGP